jgi:hypothetical protein
MPRKRKPNNNERTEKGGFIRLPHTVVRSYTYSSLSAYGVKLLVDIANQFNGKNNGDMSVAYSVMKFKGWHSPSTLNNAIKELLAIGLIEVSRKGGRNKCSLYALTFHAVDESEGKLNIKATQRPKSLWRKNEPIQDIKEAQQRKQVMDDKQILQAIMQRQKRLAQLPH